MLTDGATEEKIAELERLYQDSKPDKTPKMVAEWALANGYKQIGEDAKSAEMLARCKINVPYGIMLHKMA